jgi:hypothetical protein
MSDRTRPRDVLFVNLAKSADAGGAFGDVIEELWKEGHIPQEHYMSARRFLHDMRRFHGHSHGVVQYGERVQSSYTDRLPALGGSSEAFRRVQKLLDGLYAHDRGLFNYLVRKKELARGSLSDLGRMWSGYKTNKTTRAYMAGRVASLIATMHENYCEPG